MELPGPAMIFPLHKLQYACIDHMVSIKIRIFRSRMQIEIGESFELP